MVFSGPLALNDNQLIHIARQFHDRVSYGMGAGDGEIKCLPAFIPVTRSVSGKALVLDLGGTRLRAAQVSVSDKGLILEKGPLSSTLPLKRGIPLSRETYFKTQTDLVKRLDPEQGLPLGYCFSYPTVSEPDGDARLIRWTKGVRVPDMEGERVGKGLVDALKKQGIDCSRCVVLNDTTAILMAGVARERADAHVGLVVGTGTNMAALVPAASVTKHDPSLFGSDLVPVNLESGNFTPPYLTDWDDLVDRNSDNPGEQRFEKAVSGAYLARILQAVFPDAGLDVDKGAELVSHWAFGDGAPDETKTTTARAILDRSARLVAASLAGLLLFLNSRRHVGTVTVVAEGGLILKAPGYQTMVEKTLDTLVQGLDLPVRKRDVIRIPHANVSGSAWAALSDQY